MRSVVVSFMGLFALAFFILVFCIYRTTKKKQTITPRVKLLLVITMISIIIQMALLFAKNVPVALILHSAYLVSICGIRYAVLKIAIEVTGHEIKDTRIFRILDIIIVLDAIFLLSNVFTKALFIIEKVKIGQWYYHAIIQQPLYTLHSIIAYSLLILIAFIFIYKIVGLSLVYWGKYILLLLSFSLAIIINFFYKMSPHAVDMSVLGYAGGAVAAYFILLENKQIMLIDKMLSYIVSKTDDVMVFLDIDDICIYLNEKAKTFFGVEDDYSSVVEQINKMFSLQNFDSGKIEYSALCSMNIKGEMKHYDILYKKLYRNGKMEGSYYRIKDRTIEVDIFNKDKYKATHDKLTGLYNSDYFCDKVEEILKNIIFYVRILRILSLLMTRSGKRLVIEYSIQ